MPVPYLTAAQTRTLAPIADIVAVCREALIAHHEGNCTYSEPRMLTLSAGRTYRVKGASLAHHGVAGFRLVAGGVQQPGSAVTRLLVLSDTTTGAFIAVIEEQWMYAIRTAAAAYLALEALAPEPPRRVGIVGAGVIAHAFAEIAAASPHVTELVVTARSAASRDAFLAASREFAPLQVSAVPDAAAVMQTATAVVLATSATQPVIATSMVRPGTTLYSMGANEIAPDMYRACDKLVVDDWEQLQMKADVAALVASGRLSRARVHAELPAILAGDAVGRESAAETILIRSEGIATMDVAVAHLLAERAGLLQG